MMVEQKTVGFLHAEKTHEFKLLLSKAWLVSLSVGLVGHEVATSIDFDSHVHEHLSGPKALASLANSQEMAQLKTWFYICSPI